MIIYWYRKARPGALLSEAGLVIGCEVCAADFNAALDDIKRASSYPYDGDWTGWRIVEQQAKECPCCGHNETKE